jgi:AcrR family transcriptional regulator
MAGTKKKTLRADAERNRQRIIDAAAELFATKGLSVGLDEIAHHAGVGVGTAYRRFPDKRKLIEALFEERVDSLVQLAEAGLAADDPWEGLAEFLESATELQIANRGLRELVFGSEHGAALAPRARARIAPLVEQLVRRARESGALRDDIVTEDVPLIEFIVSSASELTTRRAPNLWRRYLGLILDGLRTPDPHPLPERGLSPDDLDAVIREAAG